MQQKLPNDLFSYMRLAHTCDEAGAREAAAFQDSVMGTHAELTAVEHLADHLQQRLARCAQPACRPHSTTLDIDGLVAGWLRRLGNFLRFLACRTATMLHTGTLIKSSDRQSKGININDSLYVSACRTSAQCT